MPRTVKKARRSQLDILCDMLAAVAEGDDKPTRIMFRANITWTMLLSNLDILLRNGALRRVVVGSKNSYGLTPKGSALLNAYSQLNEGLGLNEEAHLEEAEVVKALKTRAPPLSTDRKAELESMARVNGLGIAGPVLKGKSGATHNFDLVLTTRDKGRHAITAVGDVGNFEVMRAFVKQTDTGCSVSIVYGGEVAPGARDLAVSYGLALVPASQAGVLMQALLLSSFALPTYAILLETGEQAGFEHLMAHFADLSAATHRSVFAFTSRGSPLYKNLNPGPLLEVNALTTAVSYPTKTEREHENYVPQYDQAVLLDVISRLVSRKEMVSGLFDSVSDMLVLMQLEKTYSFLKLAIELIHSSTCSCFFVMKLGTTDERTEALIRGLFPVHLVLSADGIKVVKAP